MSQLSGGIQNEVTPYFVYGTLKPSEIAYYQIEELVEEFKPAYLINHALFARDGIPVIFKSANWNVDGFLIWPKKLMVKEFESRIQSYEGQRLYALKEVAVTCESSQINCLTHIGRNPGRSYAEVMHEPWSSKEDPIFSQSFPNLFSEIRNIVRKDLSYNSEIEDWKYYNDITSKYLLLITVIERLAYLYCGEKYTTEEIKDGKTYFNDRIMKRITTLGKSEQFIYAYEAVRKEVNISNLQIYDSRDAKKSLSTGKPSEALEAWYQVRSNLQHRGKSAMSKDVKTVQDSLIGLANVTSVLLPKFIPTLEDSIVYKQLNLAELIIASLPVSQVTDKPG